MQRSRLWPGSWQQLGVCALAVFLTLFAQRARADESGVSFWVPGQFGSLAAVPTTPGWSLGTVYYHTSVSASGGVAVTKEIQIGHLRPTVDVSLDANLHSQGDLVFLAPTYCHSRIGRPILGWHDGGIRPREHEHRRDNYGRRRSIRSDPFGPHLGLAHIGG